MTDESREIRDYCHRLANLLDAAEENSGPWQMIPEVAKGLHARLGQVLYGTPASQPSPAQPEGKGVK